MTSATPSEQPMASDRRVLTVAAVAMLTFVSIGVVSASVFAAPVCRSLTADGALDSQTAPPAAFDGDLAALADLLGEPWQTVHSAPGVRLAGAGATVFALAWVNDLTGQVDAYAPVDESLAAGDCVETAVVGAPLAFFLDARHDGMLLLRVEEDGSDPELHLVTAEGVSWSAPLELPQAPPGQTAERLTARLDEDLAVVGNWHRGGDGGAFIVAFDRATGSPRWQLDADEAGKDHDDEGRRRVDVVGVDATRVHVLLGPSDGADANEVALVPLDRDTGAPIPGRVDESAVDGLPRWLLPWGDGHLTIGTDGVRRSGANDVAGPVRPAADVVGAGVAGDTIVLTLRAENDEITAWFTHR